jgi:CO dehydrogenase nickel-insertion accessory protein CooC1
LSAARISALMDELGLNIGKKFLIINQIQDSGQEELKRMADEYKLELAVTIPEDSNIRDFDIKQV